MRTPPVEGARRGGVKARAVGAVLAAIWTGGGAASSGCGSAFAGAGAADFGLSWGLSEGALTRTSFAFGFGAVFAAASKGGPSGAEVSVPSVGIDATPSARISETR